MGLQAGVSVRSLWHELVETGEFVVGYASFAREVARALSLRAAKVKEEPTLSQNPSHAPAALNGPSVGSGDVDDPVVIPSTPPSPAGSSKLWVPPAAPIKPNVFRPLTPEERVARDAEAEAVLAERAAARASAAKAANGDAPVDKEKPE